MGLKERYQSSQGTFDSRDSSERVISLIGGEVTELEELLAMMKEKGKVQASWITIAKM